MADFDICPKCEDDFIRGDTCINCGYKQGKKGETAPPKDKPEKPPE